MTVYVEPQYKNKIVQIFSQSEKLNSVVFQEGSLESADLIIGSEAFLKKNTQFKQRILWSESPQLSLKTLRDLSENNTLSVFNQNQPEALQNYLEKKLAETQKKNQVLSIRAGIQKKRKELEELNQKLKSESDQKIQFLEKSHTEETEKNQNEKSLLHFLDFIQSESASDDFIEKLFRFIWKDIKKYTRLYTLGFSHIMTTGKSKLMTFDGSEELLHVTQVDFEKSDISQQLATLWGRPVGHILSWKLLEKSRPAYLFLEIVDRSLGADKIVQYVTERLAVLSLYLDRWMIEKEIEIVVNRWKNTFKSFSGYTHVIDENFYIYHANYSVHRNENPDARPICYQVLAGRTEPCEKCPILNSKNSALTLTEQQMFKTYYSQFKFENKKYYFVIYEDISRILSLQTQIIQTEKMSTLGRLGNHLAHELNNPLTGLKSYVQTVLNDQQSMSVLPATAASDLNEILKASVRCQKIIKNFIDFSQNKEPVLEVANLNEVLQNTLVLLKSALRSHRLFVDVKDEFILCNSHDLQQVLFNLIKNACQAMKQAGTLKIYQEIKEKKIYLHIQDSGTGFDEKILKNIFQPFTTTKPQGEGTGLGLYLSQKLIHNMQAEMQVASSAQGAKVTLIFERK